MRKSKRRSMLFVPANRAELYEKALQTDADTIIYDLEDSIPSSAKAEGRELLRQNFPKYYDGPKELSIRINDPSTPFYEKDLFLVKELLPHSVTMPKMESPEAIKNLDVFLSSCDAFVTNTIEIVGIIETPKGVCNLKTILQDSPRVSAIALGAEDLCYELGIERGGALREDPILNHILIELVLHARMYNIQCIGPVERGYTKSQHLSFLEEECKYLKKLNMCGKFAVHPTQVPIINQNFGISLEEIEQAKHLIELFREAEKNKGAAVISTNNEMQDMPSLKKSLRLIKYAKEHGYGDYE